MITKFATVVEFTVCPLAYEISLHYKSKKGKHVAILHYSFEDLDTFQFCAPGLLSIADLFPKVKKIDPRVRADTIDIIYARGNRPDTANFPGIQVVPSLQGVHTVSFVIVECMPLTRIATHPFLVLGESCCEGRRQIVVFLYQ